MQDLSAYSGRKVMIWRSGGGYFPRRAESPPPPSSTIALRVDVFSGPACLTR